MSSTRVPHETSPEWAVFLEKLSDDSPLRRMIEDSWGRCRAAGIDPGDTPLHRVSDGELARRLEARSELIAAARQHLDWISAIIASTPHVIYLTDEDGIVLLSTGNSPELLRGAGLEPGYDWSERRMGTNGAGTALATGCPEAVVGPEHYSVAFHGCTCTAAPIYGHDDEVVGALDITTPVSQGAAERLMLASHAARVIGRDLESAETARRSEALKRVAIELLTAAADPADALARLPRLLVPDLADWAVLYVPDSTAVPRLLLAHRDAGMEARLRNLWSTELNPALWPAHPVAEVLRTGAASLKPRIEAAELDEIAPDPESRELCRELEPRSYLCTPIRAAGQTLGALLLARSSRRHTFGGGDFKVMEELAPLASLALENARLRAERDAEAEASEGARREIRFQAGLLDAVEQAVIATDLEGRIRYWNGFAERLYGWSAHEVLGRNIVEVTPAPTLVAHASEIMQRMRAGESWSGRFEVQRRDGSCFMAHVTDSPVLNESGRVVGVVGISHDCTDQLEGERTARTSAARMKELYEAAEREARAREDVLAVVSHDLRNPLNVILSASSLLTENELSEEKQRRQLQLIRKSTDQMRRLIEDLLDAGRMQSGGLRIREAPVEARVVAERATAQIRPLAQEKSLSVGVDSAEGIPPVLADLDRLVQVLDNLLSNALRYSSEGGEIRVAVKPEGELEVRFTVADDGPGIAEDERSHLFERFWQGRRGQRQGAGLGLAICKGIVEAHGGRIWLDEGVSAGTTIHFTVPVAESEPAS